MENAGVFMTEVLEGVDGCRELLRQVPRELPDLYNPVTR